MLIIDIKAGLPRMLDYVRFFLFYKIINNICNVNHLFRLQLERFENLLKWQGKSRKSGLLKFILSTLIRGASDSIRLYRT